MKSISCNFVQPVGASLHACMKYFSFMQQQQAQYSMTEIDSCNR